LKLKDEINKIILTINNETIELQNINFNQLRNTNILNFDEQINKSTKIINFCKSDMHEPFNKLVNILTCDKLYNSFDEKYIKYYNLISFIYDIFVIDISNNINKNDYEDYVKDIFGRETSVVMTEDVIGIRTSENNYKKLSELTNKRETHSGFGNYLIIIDTGNTEYSLISKKFLKILKENYDKIEEINIFSKVTGMNSLVSTLDTIVRFKIEIYGDIYDIIAVVGNNSVADLVLGEKSGISLMFKNKLVINKFINNKKYDIEKLLCLNFVKELDNIMNILFSKFEKTFCVDSEMIKSFFISYIQNCITYGISHKVCKEIVTNKLEKKYDKLIKKYDNIDKILSEFQKKYKFIFPKKHINFYEVLDNSEYDSFVNSHLDALKDISLIIKKLNENNIEHFLNFCKIALNKRKFYVTFGIFLTSLVY
jgi:hypothetical protein